MSSQTANATVISYVVYLYKYYCPHILKKNRQSTQISAGTSFDDYLKSLICPPPPPLEDFIEGHDDYPLLAPPSQYASDVSNTTTISADENITAVDNYDLNT